MPLNAGGSSFGSDVRDTGEPQLGFQLTGIRGKQVVVMVLLKTIAGLRTWRSEVARLGVTINKFREKVRRALRIRRSVPFLVSRLCVMVAPTLIGSTGPLCEKARIASRLSPNAHQNRAPILSDEWMLLTSSIYNEPGY